MTRKKYKKYSAHQKEWGNKIITEFNFKGNEFILDLGCGDGVLTAQLADIVPDGFVLGIDVSQGMINVAMKNTKPNLEFKLLDINQINFKNEFDLIFSNATLHWIKNHHQLLKNTYNALKTDGILRFNFAADGNYSHFFRVIRKVIKTKAFFESFKNFKWPWYTPNLKEYESLTKTIPFSEVKIWGENADRYFKNKETMIGWIDQPVIVPFIRIINNEIRKQVFRKTVIDETIKESLQKDGTCFETFRRINLLARK